MASESNTLLYSLTCIPMRQKSFNREMAKEAKKRRAREKRVSENEEQKLARCAKRNEQDRARRKRAREIEAQALETALTLPTNTKQPTTQQVEAQTDTNATQQKL